MRCRRMMFAANIWIKSSEWLALSRAGTIRTPCNCILPSLSKVCMSGLQYRQARLLDIPAMAQIRAADLGHGGILESASLLILNV